VYNREDNSLYGSIGKKFLVVIGDKILRPQKYKKFDVSDIYEFLLIYIMQLMQSENADCTEAKKYNNMSRDLPIYHNEVTLLVSEYAADYLKNGEIHIYDYKIKSNRRITEFKMKTSDLDRLLTGLHYIIEETEQDDSTGRRERMLSIYEILRREREKYE
jgi:hypothetical protein